MSAEPTNILPFPTAKPTLEQAVAAFIEAKRKEEAAKAERRAIPPERFKKFLFSTVLR